MNLVEATLIKLATDDGLMEMLPDVPVGKKYIVDLDTIDDQDMFNTEHLMHHRKTLIHTDEGERICAELLDWPGKRNEGN